MRLEITNQTNDQECGVCALTSLHNYYYSHEKVSKDKVLDEANICENGLSIFDFEVLAQKLGLECESYEMKWSEFLDFKINKYFVAMISSKFGTGHYIIARKKKKHIEIYDSSSSETTLISYSQFEKVFLDVIILVAKHPSKLFTTIFSKPTTVLMLDLKYIILNLMLSVLLLLTSIGCASFINLIIDKAIGESSVRNVITICFIFAFVYIANDLITYILNLYVSSKTRQYSILFINNITNSLKIKDPLFLMKVDKNWIYKIDECVYKISNFYVLEINKFITSIIFSITCMCIIGCIQYYLLIPAAILLILDFVFFLFSYRKKNEIFLNITRSENKNSSIYKNLIHNLNNEIWSSKKTELLSKLSNNYSNIFKNFNDVILFKHNNTLFNSLFRSIIEVLTIGLMAYLLITNKNLTLGSIAFALASFSLFKKSNNDIFEYFLSKIEFNIYWEVYKDLTLVNNQTQSHIFIDCSELKTLSFYCDEKWIILKQNITNQIEKNILDVIKEHKKLIINRKEIESNIKFCENNFIICDQNTTIDLDLLYKFQDIDAKKFATYINYFNIDLNKKINFYNNIILNLIALSLEKNKIIFIEDVLDFLDKKDNLVVNEILNRIRKNNALFITRKEENAKAKY